MVRTLTKRRFLQLLPVSVAGCSGTDENSVDTERTEIPREQLINVSPKNPRVGDELIFSLDRKLFKKFVERNQFSKYGKQEKEYNKPAIENSFFFWFIDGRGEVDATGQSIKTRFNRAGTQIVRLLAVSDSVFGINGKGNGYSNSDDIQTLSGVKNSISDDREYEIFKRRLSVQELERNPLRLDSPRVEVFLKAVKKNVPADSTAKLVFSAANESQEDKTLEVTLRIEVPTNLTLSATSFDGGGGQYISTFKTDPGEVANESISLTATEPGSYEIRAEATYKLGGKSNTEERSMIVIFYE